jgi:hypothetical protein
MAYLDIIPLADAKVYLRIDDTLTEDDLHITRMINAALSYVEKYTNHILFARDIDYRLINGCVRVHDYPFNAYVTPVEADFDEVENKVLHTNYTYGTDNGTITLNMGYSAVTDVPQELVEVAYEIIESLYYEKDTNKSIDGRVSAISKMMLDQYKRFIF